MKGEDGFTGFLCPSCSTEIEASLDMIGQKTECPACGASLTVPEDDSSDGVRRYGDDERSGAAGAAMKSRTIRIELGDF